MTRRTAGWLTALLVVTCVGPLRGPRPAAADGPGGRQPVRLPTVQTANGLTLGPVGGPSFPLVAPVLFRTSDGKPFAVFMVAGGAIAAGAAVVYQANDCTGTPFLVEESPGAPRLFALAGVAPGGVVLVENGPEGSQTLGSAFSYLTGPVSCQPLPPGTNAPVRPAAPFLSSGALATPLRIGLQPGPVGPPAARAPGVTVEIVDATGARVGPAFALGQEATVLLRVGRRVGEVTAQAGGFRSGTHAARFASLDCTGPVFVRAPGPTSPVPLYPATALGPGNLLHSADGALVTANLQRRWDWSAGCVADPLGPVFARETSLLVDLSRFQLPLAAR